LANKSANSSKQPLQSSGCYPRTILTQRRNTQMQILECYVNAVIKDSALMLDRMRFVYDAYYGGNRGGAAWEAFQIAEAFERIGNTQRSAEFRRFC
jgi:hypothetical protein